MSDKWHQYEENVADVFTSMGADAKTNARVKGARGKHDIDVWVKFTKYGVEVRWVIECKLWKRPVTKEKIVAVFQIAQDVGADRALVFSESGFQAGAIKATQKTNVSLTSLDEFRQNAEAEMFEATSVEMIKQVEKIHAEIKTSWIDDNGRFAAIPGADLDELIGLDGAVICFKLALQKALAAEFPISYPAITDCRPVVSADRESFLCNAGKSLSEIRDQLGKFEPMRKKMVGDVTDRVAALTTALQDLFIAGEKCLFGANESETLSEKLRFEALARMKSVGRACQALYAWRDENVHRIVDSLVKLLVDTVYLYLTQPTISRDLWDVAKARIETELSKFPAPKRRAKQRK